MLLAAWLLAPAMAATPEPRMRQVQFHLLLRNNDGQRNLSRNDLYEWTYQLWRKTDDTWTVVHEAGQKWLKLVAVEARGSTTPLWSLQAEVPPGQYRFRSGGLFGMPWACDTPFTVAEDAPAVIVVPVIHTPRAMRDGVVKLVVAASGAPLAGVAVAARGAPLGRRRLGEAARPQDGEEVAAEEVTELVSDAEGLVLLVLWQDAPGVDLVLTGVHYRDAQGQELHHVDVAELAPGPATWMLARRPVTGRLTVMVPDADGGTVRLTEAALGAYLETCTTSARAAELAKLARQEEDTPTSSKRPLYWRDREHRRRFLAGNPDTWRVPVFGVEVVGDRLQTTRDPVDQGYFAAEDGCFCFYRLEVGKTYLIGGGLDAAEDVDLVGAPIGRRIICAQANFDFGTAVIAGPPKRAGARTLAGVVCDEAGRPLQAAVLTVASATGEVLALGVFPNERGEFLVACPPAARMLRISCPGYAKHTQPVTGDENAALKIVLKSLPPTDADTK